jgi:hypothetical protein
MLLLTSNASSVLRPLRVAEEIGAHRDARPTVYLDTTICSYLTARSQRDALSVQRQLTTHMWWVYERQHYRLCVSTRVMDEASEGHPKYANRRLDYIQDLPTLEPDSRSDELKFNLIGEGLLPIRARKDAEHIAIAATHSVRYLLTWNFKHLANPHIARKVVQKCESLGFRCPEICTPEQLKRE